MAVDKWKNVRLKHEDGTTEDISIIALPDAAEAMFLVATASTVRSFSIHQ